MIWVKITRSPCSPWNRSQTTPRIRSWDSPRRFSRRLLQRDVGDRDPMLTMMPWEMLSKSLMIWEGKNCDLFQSFIFFENNFEKTREKDVDILQSLWEGKNIEELWEVELMFLQGDVQKGGGPFQHGFRCRIPLGLPKGPPCDASGQFDVLGHFVWLVWKHSPGFHHVSLHKVTYQAQEPSQSRSCGNWWRLTWCYFQGDAVRHCPVDYCWYELPQTWTKKTARRHQKKATSRYIQIYHDISRCSSFYREV